MANFFWANTTFLQVKAKALKYTYFLKPRIESFVRECESLRRNAKVLLILWENAKVLWANFIFLQTLFLMIMFLRTTMVLFLKNDLQRINNTFKMH